MGNYDFGFGQEVLLAHAEAAGLPFLTANVTLADTGEFAGFAQPCVIREVSGVQVGIVGLTTTCTPHIVMPAFVGGLAPVAVEFSIPLLASYCETFPPGEITRADVVATLPFENTLVDVELTGQQVMDNLLCCGGAVAGLTYHRAGPRIFAELDDGISLDPDATYHVLVNNYMYAGGDGYLFSAQDPDAYDTGIQWREPVIELILAQQTFPERPLETLLDDAQRGMGR